MQQTPTQVMAERFDLRSADGTSLAVWGEGSGARALVLVHGSLTDHSAFEALVHALAGDVATFALDRRGYGASGEGASYALEREFEDVAAVVAAVAARRAGPVALFGHSYGANCALGAAGLAPMVDRLVLYEPSLGLPYAPGSIEAIEAALAVGDCDAAVRAVLLGVLALSADDVAAMAASPRWSLLCAAARPLAREARVEHGFVYRPGEFAAVKAATLLLSGSDSPPALRAATERVRDALAHAAVHVLAGHGHLAHKTDPERVAVLLRRFIA